MSDMVLLSEGERDGSNANTRPAISAGSSCRARFAATLGGRAAASLAGLARITRESGAWKGMSRIGGGRRGLRKALYMPALVAIRHNQQLGQIYQRLCSAGKPAKLAITAVMRKLLILANALIRDDRKWADTAP